MVNTVDYLMDRFFSEFGSITLFDFSPLKNFEVAKNFDNSISCFFFQMRIISVILRLSKNNFLPILFIKVKNSSLYI